MNLINNITRSLVINNYCERELKNIHWNRDVNSLHRIRDYGNMNERLHKLMKDGILIRFKRRNSITRRMNWYYAINVNTKELNAYIAKKQKKYDLYKSLYHKKYAATKEVLESLKHEPTVDATVSVMKQIYYSTKDEAVKRLIASNYPELAKGDIYATLVSRENLESTDKSKSSITISCAFEEGSPIAIGYGVAPYHLQGKCLFVCSGYTPEIIDHEGTKLIAFRYSSC